MEPFFGTYITQYFLSEFIVNSFGYNSVGKYFCSTHALQLKTLNAIFLFPEQKQHHALSVVGDYLIIMDVVLRIEGAKLSLYYLLANTSTYLVKHENETPLSISCTSYIKSVSRPIKDVS